MSTQSNTIAPHATAAAAQTSAKKTMNEWLQSDAMKKAVAAALPKHISVDRFIRVALNATMRNPDLLKCTQESFFRALLDLSAYGLEPDGRRAHLIPFNNKVTWTENGRKCERWEMQVQLIIDYKGIAELVRRSGDISYIHADVVYEKDEWDFNYGSNAYLKHKPNLEDRGQKIIAIYSFVKMRDGSEDFLVLSRADIDKIRAASKAPNSPAWSNWYGEMAKKSAFRRHSKWLTLSSEVRDALDHGETVDVDFTEALDAAGSMRQITDGGGLADRVSAAAQDWTGVDGGAGQDSTATEQPQQGHEPQEPSQQQPAQQQPQNPAQQPQSQSSASPGPVAVDDRENKTYTPQTLPDAMTMRLGAEVILRGNGVVKRLQVAHDELGEGMLRYKVIETVPDKPSTPQPSMQPLAAQPRPQSAGKAPDKDKAF